MAHLIGSHWTEHADGVYLALAEDRHHADTALGSTAVKRLRNSPQRWWWGSHLNTIEPVVMSDEEEAHFRLGRAVHVAVLEGMDVYGSTYSPRPEPTDYPEALAGKDALKEKCRELYLSVGGNTADLIQRLRHQGFDGLIFEEILEEHGWLGTRTVTAAEDRRIRLIQRMIMRSPEDGIMGDGDMASLSKAFTGGLSEVSVFWTDENGIRQKARFDKLKARLTIDLKTFSSWRDDRDFDQGLIREIVRRQYPIQAAHYDVGRHMLRRAVEEGRVWGGTPSMRAELERIADSDVWTWLWVFALTVGAPMVKGVRHETDSLMAGRAMRDREDALANYVHYREMFGLEPGKMWFDTATIIRPDDDAWSIA